MLVSLRDRPLSVVNGPCFASSDRGEPRYGAAGTRIVKCTSGCGCCSAWITASGVCSTTSRTPADLSGDIAWTFSAKEFDVDTAQRI